MKKDALEILTGDVRAVRHAERIRLFAACCGTQLFFRDNDGAESIDVTIASLDRPESFSPQIAIWTEDRLPWVPLDASRPNFKQRGKSGA